MLSGVSVAHRELTLLISFVFLEGSNHPEKKASNLSEELVTLCLRGFQGKVHFLKMEFSLGHTRQRGLLSCEVSQDLVALARK